MPSHDLVVCVECSRHGRARGACPFCGAPLPAPPPDRPRRIGALTRAAIFYGASALACSEPEPPPPAPEPPPPAAAPVAAQPAGPASTTPEPVAPVAPEPVLAEGPAIANAERAHAEAEKRRWREQERRRNIVVPPPPPPFDRVAPPYGAPPFDHLV